MPRKTLTALLGLWLISSGGLQADWMQPSHSCSKPYKPFQFSSEWELESFRNGVDQYKTCIADFVDEQYEEAENHRDAAQEAIDDWNNFVNYELN